MGESSYKSMRASGMDDVIFSGSGNRPARNTAEVVVTIDNCARTAPAGFNDADSLEVSRRIEREAGSTYRINGREVRARDVQLLFADAATGARSAAMVRQGQISEIIAAKPQARRRILEDAAGIAGLHARRHEAELRLRAAEENMVRIEDVLQQIDGQASSLQRQSRQALRYRTVSADIRKYEAALQLIVSSRRATSWREAEAQMQGQLKRSPIAPSTGGGRAAAGDCGACASGSARSGGGGRRSAPAARSGAGGARQRGEPGEGEDLDAGAPPRRARPRPRAAGGSPARRGGQLLRLKDEAEALSRAARMPALRWAA